jgi:glutathione S-transferase
MTITVYELAGRGEIRFSPFCWRTLLALKHKGIEDVVRVPVFFRDRAPIAFSKQERVPVIVDGDTWVNDSWKIACYLEDAYPDRPSLFGGAIGRAEALFINGWTQQIQNPGLINIILWDAFQQVDPDDRDWWRADREKRFGRIEDYRDGREEKLGPWRRSLEPLRTTLSAQPFLCGDAPAYADYTVFGTFMFARCTSDLALLEAGDPIEAWRDRMLDLFGGFARSAPAVAA